MSGAYSNKKKAEDEKLKKALTEKTNEKLLAEKKKAKNICDDAEARRNRKKQADEEKRLKEEQHRLEVLAERRRVQQEYIEAFKKNLKEQRKKAKDTADEAPLPEAPILQEETKEPVTVTPRVVKAHTVEKLLSDELKELQRRLMSTFPIKEDDDESKLSHEKEIKSVFEEAMQDEDLEQSRHIKWRDFETSQPIHSELATPRSSSSSSPFLLNSFASNDDVGSDDVASVDTDDVASLDGITDFGSTQKIPKMKRPSPPLSPSPSLSPLPSSSVPSSSIPSPSPSLTSLSSSSSINGSEGNVKSPVIKSASPIPSRSLSPSIKSSPAPSPKPTPSNIKKSNIKNDKESIKIPSSPSPSSPSTNRVNTESDNISETSDKNKQFQSRIPRLKKASSESLVTSPPTLSPPSNPPLSSSSNSISSDTPGATPISPVPIRAHSPELLPKQKSKSASKPAVSELNGSTQLFVYMEELVRKSGVSMEELMTLANNKSNESSPTTPKRNKITTGLSMEEDRLLHALRELEKTGAKQQRAIGQLYKEINGMIARKPPPPTEPSPRSKTRPIKRSPSLSSSTKDTLQAPQPTSHISQPTSLPLPPSQSPILDPQLLINNYALPPPQMPPNLQQQGTPFFNYPQSIPYSQPIPVYQIYPPHLIKPLPSYQLNPQAYLTPQPPQQISNNNLSLNSSRNNKSSQLDTSNISQSITSSSPSSPNNKPTPRGASKQSPRPNSRSSKPSNSTINYTNNNNNNNNIYPDPPRVLFNPQMQNFVNVAPPMPSLHSPSLHSPSLHSPPQVTRGVRSPSPSPFPMSPSSSSFSSQNTPVKSSPPSPSHRASPPTVNPRSQSASHSSRFESNNNDNNNNSTTPRSGGYAKKARPMFAKPVEVLASPLPTPIGSPSPTPRKVVEPSSFHKWKSAFGNPEPNTSRSHRSPFESKQSSLSDYPNQEKDESNDTSTLGEPEADLEVFNNEIEPSEMSGQNRNEEREEENDNDSDGYYDGDRFESYSSGEEEGEEEREEGKKREIEPSGRDSVFAIDRPKEFTSTLNADGKIVMSQQAARLLFG